MEEFMNTIESIKVLCKLYNMPVVATSGNPAVNVYLDKLVELYKNK